MKRIYVRLFDGKRASRSTRSASDAWIAESSRSRSAQHPRIHLHGAVLATGLLLSVATLDHACASEATEPAFHRFTCSEPSVMAQAAKLANDRALVGTVAAAAEAFKADVSIRDADRMQLDPLRVLDVVVAENRPAGINFEVCGVVAGSFNGSTLTSDVERLAAAKLPTTAGTRMLLQLDEEGHVISGTAGGDGTSTPAVPEKTR